MEIPWQIKIIAVSFYRILVFWGVFHSSLNDYSVTEYSVN
jgi:hypothetical protein